MTTMEWARQYPEISTKLFGCEIDELEMLLSAIIAPDPGPNYMTSANKAKLDDVLKGDFI